MKLNNKGFAISGILYPIFVLFLILLFGTISNLATAKAVIDRNKVDIEKQLNGDNVNPYFVMDGHDITIANGYVYDLASTIKAYSSDGKLLGNEQITINSAPAFNYTVNGKYTVTYSVTDARDRTTIDTKKITVLNPVPAFFNYTGSVQTYSLSKGNYMLEVWGAQGGLGRYGAGGNGGYVTGQLNLTSNLGIYIYVGGKGGNGAPSTGGAGGYNGGGNAANSTGGYATGGGGGGSTHIATSLGTLNTLSGNLSSILLVAGGGGGGGIDGLGGYGGGGGGAGPGYTGGNGTNSGGGGGAGVNFACGASGGPTGSGGNNSPGTGGTGNQGTGGTGGFGFGGAGTNCTTWCGGGGGGGYWGGGAGGNDSCTGSGAGGGGGSYFGDVLSAKIINGNASMPSPVGGTEVGHSGNGYAEITPLLLINVE